VDTSLTGPIGLIADSHGRNDLLNKAILMLEDLGVENIIHLGDICDSLAPLALEDAVALLKEHKVKTIKGNNEYAILTNHKGPHADSISPEILSFLSEMPYTITIGDICFAHSAPFDWPAATSWPITDDHPFVKIEDILPCTLLFRGHSHTPSIMEINRANIQRVPAEAGMRKKLSRNSRYIVTVGAVEDSSFALFRPEEYEIWFLRTDRS
jgi:predicted phosphodiesterase